MTISLCLEIPMDYQYVLTKINWKESIKILSIFCLPFIVFSENYEIFHDVWELNGGIKKVFDTPMGTVYKFSQSTPYTCRSYNDPITGKVHPADCKCNDCRKKKSNKGDIKGSLQFNFLKSSQTNKRFVVLDFKIRTYPALSKKKTSDTQFFLTRSDKKNVGSNYLNLNGMLRVISSEYSLFYTTYRIDILKNSLFRFSGVHYRPSFQPLAMRWIFDTSTGHNQIICYNEEKEILLFPEELITSGNPIEIRNFGILTQRKGSDNKFREEYLEISDPVVRQFNSSSLLNKLPPLTFSPYPYANYPAFLNKNKRKLDAEQSWRKLRQHDNPDLQYAVALQYLYGSEAKRNVYQGVELLERAAKEDHVLALYELGVCYYRGYGVLPDWNKAIKYLKSAAAYGYPAAVALQAQIVWEQAHRPLFMSSQFRRELADIVTHGTATDHDCCVFRQFFTVGILPVKEMSPKRLISANYGKELRKRYPPKGEKESSMQFLNHAISAGYLPAFLIKAVSLRWLTQPNTPAQEAWIRREITDSLEQGAQAGDIGCIVALLADKARNGKLASLKFSSLQRLQLGDDPIYLFYEFAAANPTNPGIAEFIREDYDLAEQIWKKQKNPTAEFLLGLTGWIRWYPVPFRYDNLTQMDELIKQRATAYGHLQNAAEAGIPDAMYLIARQILNDDVPRQWRVGNTPYSKSQAKILLEKASKIGHLKATLLLVELYFNNSSVKASQLLAMLQPILAEKYGPAFYLQGKIQEQEKQYADALQAYQQAANYGEHLGLREFARLSAIINDKSVAQQFWNRFIDTDRQKRAQDMYDIFWPNREYLEWEYSSQPVESDSERTNILQKQKETSRQTVVSDDPEEQKKQEEHERRRQRRTRKLN